MHHDDVPTKAGQAEHQHHHVRMMDTRHRIIRAHEILNVPIILTLSSLCLWCLCFDDDVVFGLLKDLLLAYFVLDLAFLVFVVQRGRHLWLYILHHIVFLSQIILAVVSPIERNIYLMVALNDVNSFFMKLRDIIKHPLVEFLFLITWYAIRFGANFTVLLILISRLLSTGRVSYAYYVFSQIAVLLFNFRFHRVVFGSEAKTSGNTSGIRNPLRSQFLFGRCQYAKSCHAAMAPCYKYKKINCLCWHKSKTPKSDTSSKSSK